MTKIFSLSSCFAIATLVAGIASAQSYSPSLGHVGYSNYPGNFYPGGSGYHSSTAEEGILRGYASVLQASGQANYLNSLAAINAEEARARYIKNRELATETYFRNRQINLAAREAERPERFSTVQYAALAKKGAPARLDRQQYDTTFGRLTWPVALMGDDFAADRDALDRAFGSRSPSDSGAESAFYGTVRQLTNSMQKTLKNHLNEMDSTQYVAAKKFLLGLSYESQQPLVVRALAAR